MAAYQYVANKLPHMSDDAKRSFVDGVLKDIRDQKTAGTLNQRWIDLGFDPDTQMFKEREVFAGYRYEAKTRKTLRRPQGTESGDFVDSDNIEWDVKGPIPSQGDFEGFLSSLSDHITAHPTGDEKMIVDVAGFNAQQVARVKSLLSTYNSQYYYLLE